MDKRFNKKKIKPLFEIKKPNIHYDEKEAKQKE